MGLQDGAEAARTLIAPQQVHDERVLVESLAAAVGAQTVRHAQTDLPEDIALGRSVGEGNMDDPRFPSVDGGNAERGRRAELVAAGESVVDVAQVVADCRGEIAVVKIPL